MVTLRPLDVSNWEHCANLQVAPDQSDSLPNNLFSIAELQFYPETRAVAILNDEDTIVGFATYGISIGENVPKLFRFMIDQRYQNKGYGKAALIEILKELFEKTESNEIQVCYHPNRNMLKHFYGSVGFKEKELLPCKRRKEGKMLAVLQRSNFQYN